MKSLLVLMLVSSAALADDGAMLRCRQLTDATARLSCYDAISLATPAAAPAASAAASKAKLEQDFGKEQLRSTDKIEGIESSVAGAFEGWVPNQRIRLANGQVWQISDDSSEETFTLLNNPKAIVERGAMGAFYMDIDGMRTAPRVRRVK
jgi:hypothetical protein